MKFAPYECWCNCKCFGDCYSSSYIDSTYDICGDCECHNPASNEDDFYDEFDTHGYNPFDYGDN